MLHVLKGLSFDELFINRSFVTKDAPLYTASFIFVVVSAIICGNLSLIYRFVCVRQNKKRDLAGTLEGYDHAYEDDVTDKMVYLQSTPYARLLSNWYRIHNSDTFIKMLPKVVAYGEVGHMGNSVTIEVI